MKYPLLCAYLSIMCACIHASIHSHGFIGNTAIRLCDGKRAHYLSEICWRKMQKGAHWCLASYNTNTASVVHGKVTNVGTSITPCYIRLSCDVDYYSRSSDEIVCTPIQEFYHAERKEWVPAYKLCVGDKILSKDGDKEITSIEFIERERQVYLVEVQDTHTFFVGKYSLLTHNMLLPMALSVGITTSFGALTGGGIGAFFGPITLSLGAAVGAATIFAIRTIQGKKVPKYSIELGKRSNLCAKYEVIHRSIVPSTTIVCEECISGQRSSAYGVHTSSNEPAHAPAPGGGTKNTISNDSIVNYRADTKDEAVADTILAVCEGITQGTYTTIESSIHTARHPVIAVQNFVHTMKTLVSLLERGAYALAHYDYLQEVGDYATLEKELDALHSRISTLATFCTEHLSTMEKRDIVKYAVAAGTECFLNTKVLSAIHRTCAHIAPRVHDITQSFREINLAAIDTTPAYNSTLSTPEGLFIQAFEGLEPLGNVGKEVVKDARLLLEITHASLMQKLGPEIVTLRTLFDGTRKGFNECANKYVKIAYEHILGMDINFDQKGFLKFSGFHHDFINIIEQSSVVQFLSKIVDKYGYYKADFIICGKTIRDKTFFPAHWSREQVIGKIYEAYDNFIKSGAEAKRLNDGKYWIEAFTNEGTKIRIHMTTKGLITSAYPVLH